MTVPDIDTAIIGAGPYGLSLSAQLSARGVAHAVFGQPMKFWREMPPTLNLKSLAFATCIYVPERGNTFPEWCRANGLEDFEPCPMETFARYGLEMQRKFIPDLIAEDVVSVSRARDGFSICTAAGRRVSAKRVVVATGLSYLAELPTALQSLPADVVVHTAGLSDYSRFKGKSVVVVGAGASAIEAAAMVHEAGGSARVLARSESVIFHSRTPRHRSLFERIREPMTVLGASRKHYVLEKFPLVVRCLPEERRARFVERYAGPSSPWWITDRVMGKVRIDTSSEIESATMSGSAVSLRVRTPDGSHDVVCDEVIAGTGYTFDAARLPFLDSQLVASMRKLRKAPALSMRFESSVDGLFFIGPMSAMSFGPLFRFVCGADYTVHALGRHLGRSRTVVRRQEQSAAAMRATSA